MPKEKNEKERGEISYSFTQRWML